MGHDTDSVYQEMHKTQLRWIKCFLLSVAPHNVPLEKSVLVTPFLPLSFAVPLSVLSCLKFSNNALVSDSDTFEVAPVSLIE